MKLTKKKYYRKKCQCSKKNIKNCECLIQGHRKWMNKKMYGFDECKAALHEN